MTDRELLEKAAKAAGINLIPYTWNKGTGWDYEGFTLAGAGPDPDEWDPLEDDGDALRLAVKLGIRIATDKHASAEYHNARAYCPEHQMMVEPMASDPYAAARRAIVRAAAAMVRE